MNLIDAYNILGLPLHASRDDVKVAYRRLAKQWHPDINKSDGAEARLKEINQAYELVMSRVNRVDPIWGGIFTFSNFGARMKSQSLTLELEEDINPDIIIQILAKNGIVIKGFQYQRRS